MKKYLYFFIFLVLLTVNSYSYAIDLGVGGSIGGGFPAGEDNLSDKGLCWNIYAVGKVPVIPRLELSYNYYDFGITGLDVGFNTIDLALRIHILDRKIRPYLTGGVGFAFIDFKGITLREEQETKGVHLLAGGGVDLFILKNLALSSSLKYNITITGEPDITNKSIGNITNFFTLTAGLSFWIF